MEENAIAKPGIIIPKAADPSRPKKAAGSSGLLREASREMGTCRGWWEGRHNL